MTITLPEHRTLALLAPALTTHHYTPDQLQPIRLGASSIWRIPHAGLIWKASPPALSRRAELAVRAAQWLADIGIPAVQAIPGDNTPFAYTDEHITVTAWKDLGPHREASSRELATCLRQLHTHTPPRWLTTNAHLEKDLHPLNAITWITDHERQAIRSILRDQQRYAATAFNPADNVPLHGDAWPGNVACCEDGTVRILDLERMSAGNRAYDLATIAVKATVIGQYAPAIHYKTATTYGLDVTELPQWPHLRLNEMSKAAIYALTVAEHNTAARSDAQHRLDCLLGLRGPGPHTWRPLPVAPGAQYEDDDAASTADENASADKPPK
ncbi:phosphotransferase [Streptomyces noursei]